jgi:hypothetical protein
MVTRGFRNTSIMKISARLIETTGHLLKYIEGTIGIELGRKGFSSCCATLASKMAFVSGGSGQQEF